MVRDVCMGPIPEGSAIHRCMYMLQNGLHRNYVTCGHGIDCADWQCEERFLITLKAVQKEDKGNFLCELIRVFENDPDQLCGLIDKCNKAVGHGASNFKTQYEVSELHYRETPVQGYFPNVSQHVTRFNAMPFQMPIALVPDAQGVQDALHYYKFEQDAFGITLTLYYVSGKVWATRESDLKYFAMRGILLYGRYECEVHETLSNIHRNDNVVRRLLPCKKRQRGVSPFMYDMTGTCFPRLNEDVVQTILKHMSPF